MLNKRYYRLLFGTLMAFFMLQIVHAQSKWYLNTGAYFNIGSTTMDVGGEALDVGLEYKPAKKHLFSIELRTKIGHYTFNDGTEKVSFPDGDDIPGNEPLYPPLNKNEARVKYKIFFPGIGLVPKLHIHFNKPISLFLENEFDIGLMSGNFKYKGFDKREKITEPIYCYSAGIGIEYEDDDDDWGISVSMGYSTLNFRDEIVKHQPVGYNEKIPNQHTPFYMNIIFKFSLNNN